MRAAGAGLMWMAEQIQARTVNAHPSTMTRFNPRPAGVIRDGSATHCLLRILQEHGGRWYTFGELMRLTGHSRPAVTWACQYLMEKGVVECVADSYRNPRYLKYSLVKAKQEAEHAA